MFSLQRIRDEFVRTLTGAPRMPAPESMRELCAHVLRDVAAHDREGVLDRLGRLRRADDLWDLRNALFSVVSLNHGETVARARLSEFDAAMARLPARPVRRRRDAWSATVS